MRGLLFAIPLSLVLWAAIAGLVYLAVASWPASADVVGDCTNLRAAMPSGRKDGAALEVAITVEPLARMAVADGEASSIRLAVAQLSTLDWLPGLLTVVQPPNGPAGLFARPAQRHSRFLLRALIAANWGMCRTT